MSELPLTAVPSLSELLAPGATAVRRFWRPFLLLQSCALALVVTYFSSGTVRHDCEIVSRWHEHGGLLLSGIVAAVAGGLLPEVAKFLVGTSPVGGSSRGDLAADDAADARTRRTNDIAFAFCAFFVNGIVTDIQYRGLGWVFGYDGTFLTAVKKMLADQFITTPIYGITYWAIVYRWRALAYSVPRFVGELGWRWYVQQVGPLLLPCWCFWMPTVLLVYMMPQSLQFALFCLALAAWSLLMIFIATRVERVEPSVDSAER